MGKVPLAYGRAPNDCPHYGVLREGQVQPHRNSALRAEAGTPGMMEKDLCTGAGAAARAEQRLT